MYSFTALDTTPLKHRDRVTSGHIYRLHEAAATICAVETTGYVRRENASVYVSVKMN